MRDSCWQEVLDHIQDGVTVQASTGEIVYANDRAAQILGFASPTHLQSTHPDEIDRMFEVFDADTGAAIDPAVSPWRRALTAGEPCSYKLRYRSRATHEERWATLRCVPLRGDAGDVEAVIHIFRDITAEHRREVNSRFLVQASLMLGSSLDYRDTLRQVAALAVPAVADWCAIDMLDDGGELRRLAIAHLDAERVRMVEGYRERRGQISDAVRQILLSGQPLLVREIDEGVLRQLLEDEAQVDLIRRLGLISCMVLPLRARGSTQGVITLASSESGRRYTEEDLAFAQQLANMAAMALDNAQLYTTARRELEERARAERELARAAERERQALEESEARRDLLETVLRHLPVGVLIIDAQAGQVVVANERAVEILGPQSRSGSIYQSEPGYVLRSEEGQELSMDQWPVHRSLWAGEAVQGEVLELERPDCERRHLQVSSVPIRDHRGQIVAAVALVDDITQQRQLEQQRSELLRQIESALELRNQFIATASHELKTPITLLKGYAQVLMDRSREGVLRRPLEIINRQVDRMSELINDLLDVSKIEAGKLELVLRKVELTDAVREVVMDQREAASGFEIELLAAEPVWVLGDRNRLQQVVANFISNAVKYSGNSRRVIVEVRRDGPEVEVSVTDYGIGIPEDQQPEVFGLYFRGRNVSPRHYSGLGLGLYICRNIVERHGGRIGMSSREGEGSRFWFRLPTSGPESLPQET